MRRMSDCVHHCSDSNVPVKAAGIGAAARILFTAFGIQGGLWQTTLQVHRNTADYKSSLKFSITLWLYVL